MKHFGKIILGISVFVCLFAGLYCLINPIAEQFEFDFDRITMEVGDYSGINYRIYPTSVEDYCYIQWQSSDESVAKVLSGTVYAKGVGEATITAKISRIQSDLQKSFVVVVNPKLVSSVSLEAEFTTIQVGTTAQITSKVLPYNATYQTLVWTSSNSNIISVAQDGSITALGEGTATITATAVGGEFAQIEITALTEILPESICFEHSSITLKKGHSQILKYNILPANATNKIVAWQSLNPDIVSVDENGKITAKELGTATITVTTENGQTDTCYVTVPVVEPIRLNISVDYQKILKLKVGDTYQIECSYYPLDVTYPLEWKSSNESIVSVNQTGQMTVHSSGSVVITAKLGSIERSLIINII